MKIFQFFATLNYNYQFLFNDPVCECFEYRLKIKKLLNSADGDYDKYRESKILKSTKLRAKKIECKLAKLNLNISQNTKLKEKDVEINSF